MVSNRWKGTRKDMNTEDNGDNFGFGTYLSKPQWFDEGWIVDVENMILAPVVPRTRIAQGLPRDAVSAHMHRQVGGDPPYCLFPY